MENEALIPNPTSPRGKLKPNDIIGAVGGVVIVSLFVAFALHISEPEKDDRDRRLLAVTIRSMDFTVLNMTETRLSVKWDLLIKIPARLPGFCVCLRGDFKVFIAYKGVTIATSIESYIYFPRPRWYKPLRISLIASEGDMDGAVVKNIVEDIKERGEVRFGSGLVLPECRNGTSGKMNYACDEATLRFEPGSQRDATLVDDNHPDCIYHH